MASPAPIVTVANLKGGTGKSTLAVNLACALATGGRRVVVIDADAQGTTTHWLNSGELPVTGDSLPVENERDVERWTARVLAHQDTADLVVIDAPPHLSAATHAALLVADLVLIPVSAGGPDVLATGKVLELVREVRAARDDHGPAALLVPSRIDRRTLAGAEIEGALKPFGEPIGPAVCQRTAFVDAFTAGAWVGAYAPHSTAAAEIAALASAVKRRIRA